MVTKLRVAMGSVYPYDECFIRGGVEAVAFYLTSALAKYADLELHIVSCNRTVKRSFTEQRGPITFHWLATGQRFYGLRAVAIDSWRVRRVYDQIRPDIIHAQNCSEYALGVPAKVPLILTIHGLEMFAPVMRRTAHFRGPAGVYRRWIGGWIIRQSLRKSSAVISIAGEYVSQAMSELLLGKRIYNIANPLAEDLWIETPKCQSDGLILGPGSIIERKNAVGLVQAFAEVADQLPQVRLEFAGAISEKQYFIRVQREIARLGLQNRIAFLGALNRRQLLDSYGRSSVVVLASHYETAPVAIAEAMALGKPVVATKVGAIPWMVRDGINGYLVEAGDVSGMAERIVELLSDRTKRSRIGQLAQIEARQRFGSQVIAEKTVHAYRELLAGTTTND